MIYHTKSTEESENVGRQLAEKFDSDGVRRAFVAMRGEMGVGKTAFVRGFASYFGIRTVKSPTYSIVNEYKSCAISIFHFDMYRIESDDDLFSIGYDDYIEREGYAFVEWSENIDSFIPKDAIFVNISRSAENTEHRNIEITFPE